MSVAVSRTRIPSYLSICDVPKDATWTLTCVTLAELETHKRWRDTERAVPLLEVYRWSTQEVWAQPFINRGKSQALWL